MNLTIVMYQGIIGMSITCLVIGVSLPFVPSCLRVSGLVGMATVECLFMPFMTEYLMEIG